MKLAKLGTIAAGSTLLLVGLLPGAAQASPSNHIGISGNMHIVDYDWPDANDTGYRPIGPIGMTNPGGYSDSGCVDEVKGFVEFTPSGYSGGSIQYKIDARLYEGASCATEDLDGQEVRYVWISPATTKTSKFRVTNTAEDDDDYIDFTINIQN